MNSYLTGLLVLFIVAGGGGLVLLIVGLRGRRIDEHPICRKCRYDLHNLDQPETCPECGRDLSRRRAVRTGHRSKRRWMIAAGSLLLLLGLGSGGLVGLDRAAGMNWNQYKPLWLLQLEQSGADPIAGAAADTEILRRLSGGRLADEQIAAIVNDILARQPDLTAQWGHFEVKFFENAMGLGKIGDAEIRQYLRQGIELSVVVRTRRRVRSGALFPVRIEASQQRNSFPEFFPQGVWSAYRVTVHFADVHRGSTTLGTMRRILSDAYPGNPPRHDWPVRADLDPGVHELTVAGKWQIFRGPGETEGAEPFAEWQIERNVNVEIVPADAGVIELDDDESYAEPIQASVTFDLVPDPKGYLGMRSGSMMVKTPPIDIAFDVIARAKGIEKQIAQFSQAVSEGEITRYFREPVRQLFPDAETVDIILRANPEVAERSPDIDRIWSGEIIFKDVPLYDGMEGEDDRG